jgi:hypothetical protein
MLAHTVGHTKERCRRQRRRVTAENHARLRIPDDRNHLAHRSGDAINAVLAAAGYNFRLLLRWLKFLLSESSSPSVRTLSSDPPEIGILHGRRYRLDPLAPASLMTARTYIGREFEFSDSCPAA